MMSQSGKGRVVSPEWGRRYGERCYSTQSGAAGVSDKRLLQSSLSEHFVLQSETYQLVPTHNTFETALRSAINCSAQLVAHIRQVKKMRGRRLNYPVRRCAMPY